MVTGRSSSLTARIVAGPFVAVDSVDRIRLSLPILSGEVVAVWAVEGCVAGAAAWVAGPVSAQAAIAANDRTHGTASQRRGDLKVAIMWILRVKWERVSMMPTVMGDWEGVVSSQSFRSMRP